MHMGHGSAVVNSVNEDQSTSASLDCVVDCHNFAMKQWMAAGLIHSFRNHILLAAIHDDGAEWMLQIFATEFDGRPHEVFIRHASSHFRQFS